MTSLYKAINIRERSQIFRFLRHSKEKEREKAQFLKRILSKCERILKEKKDWKTKLEGYRSLFFQLCDAFFYSKPWRPKLKKQLRRGRGRQFGL